MTKSTSQIAQGRQRARSFSQKDTSQSLTIVIILGALLRLIIFFKAPQFSHILDNRLECTTPVSSYKRMAEGVFQFLHNYNGSPYDGGIFYQSPLFLALFACVDQNWAVNLIYVASDVFLALGLAKCASQLRLRTDFRQYISSRLAIRNKKKEESSVKVAVTDDDNKSNSEPKQASSKYSSVVPNGTLVDVSALSVSPTIVAAFYLFNPFSLLATIAKSTNTLGNMVTVWAIYFAIARKPIKSLTLLALSSTLTFFPLYLAPSLIVLALRHSGAPLSRKTVSFESSTPYFLFAGLFCVLCGLFLLLSYIPTGSWNFLASTYGTLLLFGDLTPNIGLWWYFFTEMFDFFRPFFFAVFQIYLASYSVPMVLRFVDQPLFAATTVLGLCATFKSYPEYSDVGLYFCFVILYKPIHSLLRYHIPVVLVTLYCSALAPTFHHLWVYLGSGNSNFFYAINLVHGLAMTLTVADTIWAAIRFDFDGGYDSTALQV